MLDPNAVDVIAVIGTCTPERRRYARRLAELSGRPLITPRAARGHDPVPDAIERALDARSERGVVVDFPLGTRVTHVIGGFADSHNGTRLMSVLCVIDAAHLLDDLQRTDDLTLIESDDGGRPAEQLVARALLTVTQLEFASSVVLVNWQTVPTADLSAIMALVSHLNPRARLRLERSGREPLPLLFAHAVDYDGAGWMRMLNDAFDPHMTDPRVSALRWHNPRPLHPARLAHLLDTTVEPGVLGRVVRSSGFCRFATRPGVTAHWEHVGSTISFTPVAHDQHLLPDDEPLALGQDLVLIGLDLQHEALRAALDAAVLTDDELLAGRETWSSYPDPFPVWELSAAQTEGDEGRAG